jgi:hypothetical protein
VANVRKVGIGKMNLLEECDTCGHTLQRHDTTTDDWPCLFYTIPFQTCECAAFMRPGKAARCSICGERESDMPSFKGQHMWGPTDHDFTS